MGRQHKGIDIAAPYGTSVVASDGGTVVYAGYNSSGYGNLIKIDHGNGYMTYYAHNSSLCVSVGDKVAKGQLIARWEVPAEAQETTVTLRSAKMEPRSIHTAMSADPAEKYLLRKCPVLHR